MPDPVTLAAVWTVAKLYLIFAGKTIVTSAMSGIGLRGGWLCASWCYDVLKNLILEKIYEDPDLLLEKIYFIQPSNAFIESAFILHNIRKDRNIGRYHELVVKIPTNKGNSTKNTTLELPLDRVTWSFDIDHNDTTISVELYLQFLPTNRICVWASIEQCNYIKIALKQHNDKKKK